MTYRFTKLLPGNEGSCTEHFQDSQIFERLKIMDLDFDLDSLKYTYEHCNTLCQNTMLFSQCQCLDEQPTGTARAKWKFCSPCNKTEAKCRSAVIRNFTDVGNDCDDLCKPSCKSVRYDISLSKADWPNLNHQQFVMNRSFDQWNHIPEALGLLGAFEQDDGNVTDFLPKLMADLGGCLGLYLGVSVISIIEFIDLVGSASLLCVLGSRASTVRRTGSRKRRRRNRTAENSPRSSHGFFKRRAQSNKNHFRNNDHAWGNSIYSARDIYNQNGSSARKIALRWS
ncbi:lig_chan-Glu_bd domain-containing protein [Caerostris darwini]|uniref:Lig_chan-Glu_bd domain-containing protein n=1 Tax=Caerostris darwini TaxID=1538125 RepID=A0AAV4NSH6_9ARAC|nr:lig_chan-Glu_bd domain-containing protein [Caerostris darwini]